MIIVNHSAGTAMVASPQKCFDARPGLKFSGYGTPWVFLTGVNGYVRGSVGGQGFSLSPDSLLFIDRTGRISQTRNRYKVNFFKLSNFLLTLWPRLEKGADIEVAMKGY
jgi:hypothetical protein